MTSSKYSPSTIAAAIAATGVFRAPGVAAAGIDLEGVMAAAETLYPGKVVGFDDGWFVVLDDDTVAANTVLRVAGAYEVDTIPYADISKSVRKMAAWGDIPGLRKRDAALAAHVMACMDDYPSDAVVAALCAHVGAACGHGQADFTPARKIEPKLGNELEMLTLLVGSFTGYASTAWFARHLTRRPSRTSLDYTIVPSIPFLLKEADMPVRLLGSKVPAKAIGRSSAETYVNMRRSPCRNRVVLEYRINEEAVEGNSFNVPPECKAMVDGEFVEVNTGKTIRFDANGKDARKFVGIGVVIRESYPNYTSGETAYVVIDRAQGVASVEIGLRHHHEFEDRVDMLLRQGVTQRPLTLPMVA